MSNTTFIPPAASTPQAQSNMPSPRGPATLPPLTLIVATTPISSPSSPASASHNARRLGIGHSGTLPWPRIKSDMTFFSRVTTRAPLQVPTEKSSINAVIMGRKTYDSLPERFRPLPRRLNVVITRDGAGDVKRRVMGEWRLARRRELEKEREKMRKELGEKDDVKSDTAATTTTVGSSVEEEDPDVLISPDLPSALQSLQTSFPSRSGTRSLGKIFIIGGSEIYFSALRLDPAMLGPFRIVMTDIRHVPAGQESSSPEDAVDGWECDTFFPVDNLEGSEEWRAVGKEEISEWVGEKVSGEWMTEGDVVTRVVGFERVVG